MDLSSSIILPFVLLPDISRVFCEIILGELLPISFQGGSLKKNLGFILVNQKKNQVSTLQKSGCGGTLEKSGCLLEKSG